MSHVTQHWVDIFIYAAGC